jgi:UDP-N-acetylglucosamine--N-acetylmuramyl-(pentapeptide) pyrophosphoryl-undecaprenol N-acetylglucosamine transferase
VVLAGGGTGGHVYPGLAVASALADEVQPLELLYIGVRGRVDEAIVPREGIAFKAVSAGPLRVSSPVTFAGNLLRLGLGVVQSMRELLRFKPDVVFATGGYTSVPVGVAARVLRKPMVVFLPDVTPGWAVRLLSRVATRMATTSDRALRYLPAQKTVVVGYPVRGEFWTTARDGARQRLNLPRNQKVVLVTGASLGARKINETVVASLAHLLPACIVVHVTGAADEAWALEQRAHIEPALRERYMVHGYIDDLPAAMIAADLAVMRAGASTLGELPAAGLPSVLVPGEYEGWSQAPNAEFLQERGAAVVLRNAELGRLADVVIELLSDEGRLASMRTSARALARPDAARDLARLLVEVAA